MNLKYITRKRRVKDDFRVAPSSFMIKRLVGSLENSYDIIKTYFPCNSEENKYLNYLKNMMIYFNEYN